MLWYIKQLTIDNMDTSDTELNPKNIWSRQIFQDIIQAINQMRNLIQIQSDLDRMTIAIRRGVPFGITPPPIDYTEKINIILGDKPTPRPPYFIASEMGAARIKLAKENVKAISLCKTESSKMVPLCRGSDIRVNKLLTDIRMELNKRYRLRNQWTIDMAISEAETERNIERFFDTFLAETQLDGNIIIDNDALTDMDLPTAPPLTLHKSTPNRYPTSTGSQTPSTSQTSSSSQSSVSDGPTTPKQIKIPDENSQPLNVDYQKINLDLGLIRNILTAQRRDLPN